MFFFSLMSQTPALYLFTIYLQGLQSDFFFFLLNVLCVFVFSYAVKLFTVEYTKAFGYINNYICVYIHSKCVKTLQL